MINDKLIDAFLKNAKQDDLIKGIKEILKHFKIENEYRYEQLVNNLVNIIGGDKLITISDIDIELVKANISNFTYKSEEIDKDSIEISDIDHIDKTVKILYKRQGNDYKSNERLEYADYLKKVKEN